MKSTLYPKELVIFSLQNEIYISSSEKVSTESEYSIGVRGWQIFMGRSHTYFLWSPNGEMLTRNSKGAANS